MCYQGEGVRDLQEAGLAAVDMLQEMERHNEVLNIRGFSREMRQLKRLHVIEQHQQAVRLEEEVRLALVCYSKDIFVFVLSITIVLFSQIFRSISCF